MENVRWETHVISNGMLAVIVIPDEYAEKFDHGLVPGAAWNPMHEMPNGTLEAVALPYGSQIFFSLYFVMTGIHAAHMVVGIALMAVMLWMAGKRRFGPDYYGPVEVSGLYWHFVDIVWIFLFPLLYLLGYHFAGAGH